MNIGNRIKRLRLSKKIKAIDFSNQIGISRVYLNELERGVKTPSLETLQKICEKLDITLTDFFAEKDDIGPEFRELLNNAKHLSPEQLKNLNDFLKSLRTVDTNEKRQ